MQFSPKAYGVFSEQLRSLPPDIQQDVINAVNTHLKNDPTKERNPVRSKLLDPPLECIRRIHVDDNWVIAYVVCDECKNIDCDKKLGCYRCYNEPWWRVKLIAVGPWDGFYKELESSWRTWINTLYQV